MTRRALPSDPLNLLRESADVVPPAGAAQRVAARLASGAGAAAGAVVGAAGLSARAPGATGARPTLAPSSAWSAWGARFVRGSWLPLGGGGALGVAGHAWLSSGALRPQPALPVAQPGIVASAPAVLTAEAMPPVLEAEAPVNPEPAASSVVARSSLPEERALLDRARRQLASDEPERALTFLQQHAQRYARGALTEEREAMWVNVLVLLGRRDDARARGEAFQARFPNSLMGANVRAALRAARVEE